MKLKYSVRIDCASKNAVTCSGGEFVNSIDKYTRKIWLGVGDFCLCAEKKSCRITGFTGSLRAVGEAVCAEYNPVQAMDGAVILSGERKLKRAVYVAYPRGEMSVDKDKGALMFGDVENYELAVRVCANMLLLIKNDDLCGAIVENINFNDSTT